MNLTGLLEHILWLAIEDYSCLWEVVWEINTRYPELLPTQRKTAAAYAVRTLLSRRWIKLYQCQEPYGTLTPLRSEEYEEALSETANWAEPGEGTVSIRIGATEEGERAYQAERYYGDRKPDPSLVGVGG